MVRKRKARRGKKGNGKKNNVRLITKPKETISEIIKEPAFPQVIAIVSGKGGVGKTTTTANIGSVVSNKFEKKVLVIDGNVTTSNLGLQLGFLYPPVTLHDVLDGTITAKQSTYVHKSGLHVIPASLSVERDARYNEMSRAIDMLRVKYDLIIIDGAAGVGSEVKAAMRAADAILVITVPEIPTITASVKIIETAKKMKVPIAGIIVNRVKRKKHEISLSNIERVCHSPILAVIPEDNKVSESMNAKEPVVIFSPNSPASLAYQRLSSLIMGMKHRTGFFQSFLEKVYRIKHCKSKK